MSSPAVEPDPPRPVEKTYRVTGAHPVRGQKPGARFTATLPLEQERLLLAGGHIKVVKPRRPQPETKE